MRRLCFYQGRRLWSGIKRGVTKLPGRQGVSILAKQFAPLASPHRALHCHKEHPSLEHGCAEDGLGANIIAAVMRDLIAPFTGPEERIGSDYKFALDCGFVPSSCDVAKVFCSAKQKSSGA